MVSLKLQVGQFIELKEISHSFEYSVVPSGGTGQEVLEVGSDYVVVSGSGDVLRVRYPSYLLHLKETASAAPVLATVTETPTETPTETLIETPTETPIEAIAA